MDRMTQNHCPAATSRCTWSSGPQKKRSVHHFSGNNTVTRDVCIQVLMSTRSGRFEPTSRMLKFCASLASLAIIAAPVFSQTAPSPDETRLMRFPATNGHDVVFSYADQLYTVGLDGGIARRLTNGPGYAIFPRFSPDGTQLAFTAQYDGNTEVYLMPADGGTPKRLTYTATLERDDLGDRMGPNNIVMAWKNTSPEVLFRSRMRSYNPFNGQLYSVGTDGDL